LNDLPGAFCGIAFYQFCFPISRFVRVFERGLVWIWIVEVLRHFFLTWKKWREGSRGERGHAWHLPGWTSSITDGGDEEKNKK
jgi:hypothetical protein